MRVAILHDYLNQLGGAERVLEEFIKLFPNAPIFTLFYDEVRTQKKFSGKDIRASFLQHIPRVADYHHYAIPIMPLAARNLSVRGFDIVLSSSSGYAKGITVNPNIFHINYCYTPLRYAWENKYLNTHPIFQHIQKGITPILSYLRTWDQKTSSQPHEMYTISNHIAKKIKKHYRRDALVVYPPVDTTFFYPSKEKGDFYLVAGRMLHYKRFDLVVSVFNELGLPLKVIGSGPEEKRLKKIAHKNIEFLGIVSDEKLRDYYSEARVLIFPQQEDFGLVAAEALSCGTPVIAYTRGGGPEEIVKQGENGLFFEEQTKESLMATLVDFKNYTFTRENCRESVAHLSKEKFREKIKTVIYNGAEQFYGHSLL